MDPAQEIQPGWSPYKAFFCNPLIYIDPNGKTEYVSNITINKKDGTQTIKVNKANKLMTDGVRFMSGTSGAWYYSYNYYDYHTLNLTIIEADGTVTETTKHFIKYDSESVPREVAAWGEHKRGETITDKGSFGNLWGILEETRDHGGIQIWGLGSGSESLATKTKGEIWGEFDLKEFNDLMELLGSAGKDRSISRSESISSAMEHVLPEMANEVQKAVKENTLIKREDIIYSCPYCSGGVHLNDSIGHDKNKNQVYDSRDNKEDQ